MKQVYLYVGGGVAEITPKGRERSDFIKLTAFGQRVELEQEQARQCILAGVALLTEQELNAIFDADDLKVLRRGGREVASRFDGANPEKSNAMNLKLLKLDEAVGLSRKKAAAAPSRVDTLAQDRKVIEKQAAEITKAVGGEN